MKRAVETRCSYPTADLSKGSQHHFRNNARLVNLAVLQNYFKEIHEGHSGIYKSKKCVVRLPACVQPSQGKKLITALLQQSCLQHWLKWWTSPTLLSSQGGIFLLSLPGDTIEEQAISSYQICSFRCWIVGQCSVGTTEAISRETWG